MSSVAFIVLAAGMGTRMKSSIPKVLHKIAGRSMLSHVLSAAMALSPDHISVVVGPEMDDVADEARVIAPDAKIAVQTDRLGTADAVKAALPGLRGFSGSVIVLFGDTPLIKTKTLQNMHKRIEDGAGLAVLGFQTANPHGYGRLVLDENGRLIAIREEADASPMEKSIKLCNSGVMAFNAAGLPALIEGIGNNNSKGEFYLTNAVQIAALASMQLSVTQCDEEDVLGINSREQLAVAEAITQDSFRLKAMAGGATLVAPETVFFSHDTTVGQDVLIEPNVVFGLGVSIKDGATIHAFSHLEHCRVREFATVGPFARLRPDADIGQNAKVGSFVEVKKAVIERGAKINHLSYIGDARVGEDANVGAGTITCNYDGTSKHYTDIGAGAFIGSNSSLVAPVQIGEGAYVGSGSVISKDVEADTLAVTRPKQIAKAGWAARKRDPEAPKSSAAETTPPSEEPELAVEHQNDADEGHPESHADPQASKAEERPAVPEVKEPVSVEDHAEAKTEPIGKVLDSRTTERAAQNNAESAQEPERAAESEVANNSVAAAVDDRPQVEQIQPGNGSESPADTEVVPAADELRPKPSIIPPPLPISEVKRPKSIETIGSEPDGAEAPSTEDAENAGQNSNPPAVSEQDEKSSDGHQTESDGDLEQVAETLQEAEKQVDIKEPAA